MKTVALVQARMGSTRLPGKVLAPLAGLPMIGHVLRRAAQSGVAQTMLVTSVDPGDDALAAVGSDLGFPVYRGSQCDVLDRYFQAAKQVEADVVVRVTGDCPLVDPELIDRCLAAFATGRYDYVSTAYPTPSWPDGLDVEAASAAALGAAWREAGKPSEREHVMPFIWTRPQRFRLGQVASETNLSHLRWTVDEPADLAFMRELFSRIDPATVRARDVLTLLAARPDLAGVNAGIARNEGYRKSLLLDAAAKGGRNT